MADAGAPYTTKQANTIGEGSYIVIDNRACEVHSVVSDFVTKESGRKRGKPMLRFIAYHIFTRNEFQKTCLPSDLLQLPLVKNTDYEIVDISQDGSVTLLTETDEIKVFNVTDADLLKEVRAGLAQQKKLFATVMSAMGEEQVCGFKVINPI